MSDVLLAFDPGTHTGWARFRDGKPDAFGVAEGLEELVFLLERETRCEPSDWLSIVVEDYKIRPQHLQGGFAHQWGDGIGLRAIGVIEAFAIMRGIYLKKQQPSVKPIAAKLTGLPYTKGKKNMHHADALLHGAYFIKTEKVNAEAT